MERKELFSSCLKIQKVTASLNADPEGRGGGIDCH